MLDGWPSILLNLEDTPTYFPFNLFMSYDVFCREQIVIPFSAFNKHLMKMWAINMECMKINS